MLYAVVTFIVALGVIAITHWVYKWYHPKCNGTLPPGSFGLPLVGESIQFFIPGKSMEIPSFLTKRMKKYGAIFKTSLVGRPVVVSTDAEFNHYILQQEGKLVEIWYMDSFSDLFEQNGSFKDGMSSTGHMHKYIRKTIAEHLGTETLKAKVITEFEDMINSTLQDWSTRDSVELKFACSKVILNFTAKLLFGYDPNKSEGDLYETIASFIKGLLSFPFNIPGTAYHRSMKVKHKILKVISDAMKEKKASPAENGKGDLLDTLIRDMEVDKSLNEDLIVYIIFALMIATVETIPINLTLLLKMVTDHPLVLQELKKESEEIIRSRENPEGGITWKEYKSMTSTMQAINESLRIGGGSGVILRKAIEDIHINGYTIPKGWALLLSPLALHLNPEIFRDPITYNPSRWKESDKSAKYFIPFGGGMRSCPGSDYSRGLLAMFLHVILTKFRWTPVNGGGPAVRTPLVSFKKGYHIRVMST